MFETDATNLPRIMNCNGSASMAVFKPAIDDANSILRAEGIAAHYLAVQMVTGGQNLIGKKASNGIFMTDEMESAVAEYVDYIQGRSPDRWFSEMETESSHWSNSYRVNGRADNITHTQDDVLFVDDFKYGFKIVEPKMNWTLISHAIGYCLLNNVTPQKFVFTIIQPRAIHNEGIVRQWVISQAEFLQLYHQLTTTLSNLSNTLNTGDHCRRCPSLVYCSAATQAGYNAVEMSDTVYQENISNSDLSKLLDILNIAKKRISDKLDALEEFVLHKVKSGEVVENYMAENALGNTTWQGYVDADLVKALTGLDARSGKMLTPNQVVQLGASKEFIDTLTHRPNRGVKLKRVETSDKASKMFSHMKGEQT